MGAGADPFPARIVTFLARLAGAILLALVAAAPVRAEDPGRMILHLLDYMAVDYAGAVADGKVANEDEYREMTEFAGQVVTLLKAMPDRPSRAALEKSAVELGSQVARKAPAPEVAAAARTLRDAVIRTYTIPIAPRQAPDVTTAAPLYAELCAGCHGATGGGDGPMAKGLEPQPANFLERAVMLQKSAFSLYNTIGLGLAGTSMPAFSALSDAQRWSLAFYIAGFSVPAEQRRTGEALWKSGKGRGEFSNIGPVATLSPEEALTRHGANGAALQAYLLSNPGVLAGVQESPLDFSTAKLDQSLEAYRKGDRARAGQLAIQSYLEGFELVEHQLAAIDAELMARTERSMMAYRQAVESALPLGEVEKQAAEVRRLLAEARERLGSATLSPAATFLAALVILLREGIEAVLVVAAILAFAGKVGEARARRYVHIGWILALLLGVITFYVSTKLIAISGADREVTEGVTALVAAAILLYVGFWLHDKTHADAWQKYIRQHVGGALANGTLWTLSLVSFLAVYRELFETILFYQALAAQSGPEGHAALVGGIGVGAVLLAIVTWAILRYSRRLPLSAFFAVSAALMAVLAVVFTGQGIAALQEAGWIKVNAFPFVRVPILGIFPTLQTLGAQLTVACVIVAALWWARRSSK
jgi:high-affinity iron transporter